MNVTTNSFRDYRGVSSLQRFFKVLPFFTDHNFFKNTDVLIAAPLSGCSDPLITVHHPNIIQVLVLMEWEGAFKESSKM